ncbi:MAG: helix-turn-helix domain-containing protein, partial [Candidatus Acidiferrales bacterium]
MATAPYAQASQDYQRVEKALAFLGENFQRQPALREVAQSAGLSEYHFQRLFRRWVGISPKRFLQFLTKEHAKELLRRSNLLDASYEVGLSGPGRLHDLFVNCEAVTPGEFKSQGASLRISYGFHPTPFGEVLLATTDRGLCGLYFVVGNDRRRPLAALRQHWPEAILREDAQATAPLVRRIFSPRTSNGR